MLTLLLWKKTVPEGSVEQGWEKRQKQQTNKNKLSSSFTMGQQRSDCTIPRREYSFSFSIPVGL